MKQILISSSRVAKISVATFALAASAMLITPSQAQEQSPHVDLTSVIPAPGSTVEQHLQVGGTGTFTPDSKSYTAIMQFFHTKDGGTEELDYTTATGISGQTTIPIQPADVSSNQTIDLARGHYGGRYFVVARPSDNSGDVTGGLPTSFTIVLHLQGPGGDLPPGDPLPGG